MRPYSGAKVDHVSWVRLSVIASAALGLSACGASAPSSATDHVLTGQGTSWHVVITADPGDVTGLALDGHGHIYLAEIDRNQIAEYSVDGTLTRKWGTQGSGPGQLSSPAKLAVDKQGDVYVTDLDNNRVQKFSATGKPLNQWGGPSSNSEPGRFNFPIGIAVDTQGDVYVVDAFNYRIQKLSPVGAPIAQWGSEGEQPGQFSTPYDVALDAKGNVYISEVHGNDRVQEFSPAGSLIAHWGDTERVWDSSPTLPESQSTATTTSLWLTLSITAFRSYLHLASSWLSGRDLRAPNSSSTPKWQWTARAICMFPMGI